MPLTEIPIGDVALHDTDEGMSEPVANEGYFRLARMAWCEVLDRDLTAPPGGESEGDIYLVADSATGAWSGKDGDLALYYSGKWFFHTPAAADLIYLVDEDLFLLFTSTWVRVDIFEYYFKNALVIDRDLTAPPGSESDGDLYIVADSATGAWSGKDGDFALFFSGTYFFRTPRGGDHAFVVDEKIEYAYSSVESLWYPVQEIWIAAEHWTGHYSVGGNKIYSKTLYVENYPSATTLALTHSISSINLSEHFKVTAYGANGTDIYHFPNLRMTITIDTDTLNFQTANDFSSYSGQARIEYCKS